MVKPLSILGIILLIFSFGQSCGKSKKSNDPPAADNPDNPNADKGFAVGGTLALNTFGLNSTLGVTHVIGFNAETGVTAIAEVKSNGSFKLPLNPILADEFAACINETAKTADKQCLLKTGKVTEDDIKGMTPEQLYTAIKEDKGGGDDGGSFDPNDPTPWILMYVNKNKIGGDMVVSRFASQTLDTIAPKGNSTASLDLGEVTPVAGGKATSATAYSDVLAKTGLSAGAAATLGALDQVSLRHSNPDIDNNGVFDANEGKHFILDFHNRFGWKDSSGTNFNYQSFKNKFPEEVAGGLANLAVNFQGTGIVPELEKSNFTTAPAKYKWKFKIAAGFTGSVELNSLGTCVDEGNVTTVADGAWCTQNHTENPTYPRYQLGLEVKTPPPGDYTLEAGGKTFTWTNVEVSDFSAGEGFLALMYKIDVNPGDNLTGITYKYMKRSSGTWVSVTEEDLSLILKSGRNARIGFQFGSGAECGWSLARSATGNIVFKSSDVDKACNSNTSETIKAALKADAQPFSSLSQGPGVSYDDKMGMRFFF